MAYGVVYLLTNLVNGKYYIGQTTDYAQRMGQHSRTKVKTPLACAIRAHGWENFSREILGEAEDKESLDNLEKLWMIVSNATEIGYNLKEGGSAGKHAPETRAKMSLAKKLNPPHNLPVGYWTGKKRPDVTARLLGHKFGPRSLEARKRMSDAHKGKIQSPESNEKRRAALLGRKRGPVSEETRRKLSESHMGQVCWCKGKKRPDISERNRLHNPNRRSSNAHTSS